MWILIGFGLIGLTWLPVYGVAEQDDSASRVTQETDSNGAPDGDSRSLDQVTTNSPEETMGDSPEMTLFQQLEARSRELEKRDQALSDEAQRLETLRQDLEALAREHAEAIAEAVKYRDAQKAQKKIDPTEQSLEHLIKVYEAMDAEDAALRLEKMKEPLALDILAGIKEKKAASMLAGVEPGKAARLTEGLRNYGKKKKAVKP